jgi:hypothetical protein
MSAKYPQHAAVHVRGPDELWPLVINRRFDGASDALAPAHASNAQIRSWAAGQGFDIAGRGRLPADVVAAYRLAHSGSQ